MQAPQAQAPSPHCPLRVPLLELPRGCAPCCCLQVGAKLVVLNLSQQTDSSDLLGGFRPVEARDALAPLLPVFSSLVVRTWTRGRNIEFLARVSKLAERRKWSQLLTTFRSALRKVGLI